MMTSFIARCLWVETVFTLINIIAIIFVIAITIICIADVIVVFGTGGSRSGLS